MNFLRGIFWFSIGMPAVTIMLVSCPAKALSWLPSINYAPYEILTVCWSWDRPTDRVDGEPLGLDEISHINVFVDGRAFKAGKKQRGLCVNSQANLFGQPPTRCLTASTTDTDGLTGPVSPQHCKRTTGG